ncbi:MAG: hypothetical protein RLZ44_1125 [Pseudomonadota bacterium]
MTVESGRTDAPLDADTLRAWLLLLRAPGTGSRTLLPLLGPVPDPRRLAAGRSAQLPARLRDWLRQPDWAQIDQDLTWLAAPEHHLVPIGSAAYPPLLRETPDPPLALFVLGDPELLALPQIAMVGSRNPSSGGRRTAHDFAAHFAARGLTVTSGLASGIDGACHQGALDGGGLTLAVTGTGLDRVYPASHRELAHRIVAAGGALVSEFPPGTPPKPGHFPRRNRIISGLALGTLVVEAALQSGSLITARQALEQGREVFAIPGSIHNPLARGCHRLIREGAKLVETADDVLEELGPLLGGLPAPAGDPVPAEAASPSQDPDYQRLLGAMGYDPMAVDTLVALTGLAPASVSSMLLLLELEGHVSSVPGGLFARTGKPPA